MNNVESRIHLGLYENETSVACDWHLNEALPRVLGRWPGVGRHLRLQQPIILPLFGGKSAIEVLAMLSGDNATEGYDLVRRSWTGAINAGQYDVSTSSWPGGPIDTSAERAWRSVVHGGVLAGTAYERRQGPARTRTNVSVETDNLQLSFRQCSKAYDGRYANNGWLQETPELISKITWDNPAWISVDDAVENDLKNGDVIEIAVKFDNNQEAKLECPVMITPGQARRVGADVGLGPQRKAGGSARAWASTPISSAAPPRRVRPTRPS